MVGNLHACSLLFSFVLRRKAVVLCGALHHNHFPNHGKADLPQIARHHGENFLGASFRQSTAGVSSYK